MRRLPGEPIAMGAVAIYGEHPGYATTDVTVSDLTITNTPPSAILRSGPRMAVM